MSVAADASAMKKTRRCLECGGDLAGTPPYECPRCSIEWHEARLVAGVEQARLVAEVQYQNGHPRMHGHRFVTGFLVLVTVPPGPPGATIDDMAQDLQREGQSFEAAKHMLSRLMRELREIGFVESARLPSGKQGYYLTGDGPKLLKKLGLA